MPSLDELLNKAQSAKSAEPKKFSRGNRPDTLLNALKQSSPPEPVSPAPSKSEILNETPPPVIESPKESIVTEGPRPRVKKVIQEPSSSVNSSVTSNLTFKQPSKIPIDTNEVVKESFIEPVNETFIEKPILEPVTAQSKVIAPNIVETPKVSTKTQEPTPTQKVQAPNLNSRPMSVETSMSKTTSTNDSGSLQNLSYKANTSPTLNDQVPLDDVMAKINLEPLNESIKQESVYSRENLERFERESRETILEKSDFSRYSLENTQRKPREIEAIPRENLDFLQVKPREIPRENLERFQVNSRENSTKKFSIAHLVGLQKKVLFSLFQLCRNNNSNFTKDISGGELALICETSMYNAQNAVKELVKKQLIFRKEYKSGRGGYTKYEIDQDTYLEIFEYLKANDPILEKTQRKPRDYSRENLEKSPSSKLVSNNNTNFLTSSPPQEFESGSFEVAAIDVSRLSQFGISRKQIQDIYNQKLKFTTSDLQDFVERFEIYVSDPKVISGIRSVPGIFVKMAQLAARGEDPLVGIETETDRALREQLERLKRQREERQQQEHELCELEFETWAELLDENERDQLVPPNGILKAGSQAQKIILKNYFIENIWPAKKINFLKHN